MPSTTDRTRPEGRHRCDPARPLDGHREGIYTSPSWRSSRPRISTIPTIRAPGAIVLLSDGATIDATPADAATEAEEERKLIYTIAYGTSTAMSWRTGNARRWR